MKADLRSIRLLLPGLMLLFSSLACAGLVTQGGATITDSQSISLDGAASVHARIVLGVGELSISGGTENLMDGTFRYKAQDWQPKISYNRNVDQGELLVQQPDRNLTLFDHDIDNTWEILLNKLVPLDLEINSGTGKTVLNLQEMNLTSLSVDAGAGSTTVNLNRDWDHDVNVTISSGAGALDMKLPSGMGVQVQVDQGLGGINTAGLDKDGENYINQSLGQAASTLYIQIEAGTGSINLEVQ
jgi:N-terminal domain of toast_rack, DUF2154